MASGVSPIPALKWSGLSVQPDPGPAPRIEHERCAFIQGAFLFVQKVSPGVLPLYYCMVLLLFSCRSLNFSLGRHNDGQPI